MLLSAVPLSMFLVSLMQNLNIPFDFIEQGLRGFFSDKIVKQVTEYLSSAYNDAVGISFVMLIVTLWSAAQGIHSITNGLNRIYNAYENRNWFLLRFRAMFYTVALFALIFVILFVIVLGTSLSNLLTPIFSDLPDAVEVVFSLRYVIIFIILTLLFALIYRNFPNISRKEHREYGFKYQLPGAVLCSAAWYLLSLGISIYVDDFNGFSIYGSLTRLAVIMIWLYFCMVSLMICAEINYVYHDFFKNRLFRKNRKNKM